MQAQVGHCFRECRGVVNNILSPQQQSQVLEALLKPCQFFTAHVSAASLSKG